MIIKHHTWGTWPWRLGRPFTSKRGSHDGYRFQMRQDLPHQGPVLAWALPRPHAAFFMDMRLGKTHVAIRWAEHRSPNGIKLVVAPIVTHVPWCDELEADGCGYVRLGGNSQQKLETLDARKKSQRWVIVNPEGLRACPAILAGLPISVVILDESTFIANPKSEITKLIRRELRNVPNKAILTGEPAPEGWHQYYEQMSFVCGTPWMKCHSFWQWRARYFRQSFYEWKPYPTTEGLVLRELKEQAYRMSSRKVFSHKPIYMRRHVEMSHQLAGVYKKAVKDFSLGDMQTKWTLTVRTWLAQMAGGAIPEGYAKGKKLFSTHKVAELKSLLEGELASKQVVVFFRFNRELLYAARQLHDITVVRGTTPFDERKQRIKDFQKGKVRVLLMQAKCAKYALPLWMASAAVFYSNYWECGTRNQLEARLHGAQRKDPPLYIDLVTKGTVDEAVVKALREKKWDSNDVLDRIQELTHDALN